MLLRRVSTKNYHFGAITTSPTPIAIAYLFEQILSWTAFCMLFFLCESKVSSVKFSIYCSKVCISCEYPLEELSGVLEWPAAQTEAGHHHQTGLRINERGIAWSVGGIDSQGVFHLGEKINMVCPESALTTVVTIRLVHYHSEN